MDVTKEDIINFLSDENLEKLANQMDSSPNIFKILKSESAEIKHSNMLAYLLDPSENHGLGTKFIEKFLRTLSEDPKLFLSNYDSFIVKREWKHIDLLLCSSEDNIVVAIENKINSGEHSNQLERYKKNLEEEYKDYDRHYIFLTLEGEDAPYDNDIWKPLGYQTVINLLEKTVQTSSLGQDVEILINHYIKALKELLKMESPEITELKNKVFQKHKEIILELAALEGNPRIDLSNMLNDFFDEWESEHQDYNFIKNNNTYKWFYTKNLKDIIPDTDHLWYEFWIDNWGDSFGITLSLRIKKGYPDHYSDIANKLYEKFLKNKKISNKAGLRAWKIKYNDDSGNKKEADTIKAELEKILFANIPKLEQDILAMLQA